MNATKILWGQIFLVCGVVVLFLWAATEWTAWQLAFQARLGQPWCQMARKRDPGSASNRDPSGRRFRLVPVANGRAPRGAE